MNRRKVGAAGALLALAALVLAGCATVPGIEVPYVQTPSEVVTAMLRLAEVGPTDVVYDLGSGDGRVVIAAARDFGASGLGVELDPKLVVESNELARKAGVGDRARFLEQDIFVTDLSPASVVTLYLSPDLNARLRPRLLSQLKPGSRIVSHDFPMAGWAPARQVSVSSRDRTHTLYLWIVPAR